MLTIGKLAALTETSTVPWTVAPFDGEVMLTVGAVPSPSEVVAASRLLVRGSVLMI